MIVRLVCIQISIPDFSSLNDLDTFIMDVIQLGVNVAGSRKKNHLCQCPWQGHGPRPVPVRCTKCMRVRVVSRGSFNFFVLLDHNTRSPQNNRIYQVRAIALIIVSPPDFLWISCSFHLHSIQLRSLPPITLHFLGNSLSDQCIVLNVPPHFIS